MHSTGMATTPIFIKDKPAKNQDQVFAYLEGGYESRSHVAAEVNGRVIGFNQLPLMTFYFATEEDAFVLYRDDWGLSRP